MTNNHIMINIGTKIKKENKITPLYTLNLEVILLYKHLLSMILVMTHRDDK